MITTPANNLITRPPKEYLRSQLPTLQKLFLYARKSTDTEDKQVLSIEAQITELREFAKRESISIIEELIEKQSAKIPGRPVFNSMIERIEKGEAAGILAWHPDRLARNSIDGGRIIYLVDTGKIKFLKFPQFWFESTPQGKFMLNIAFGQSKYYVDSLSENTKRGLRQKVRKGEFPSLAPIGYLNNVRTKKIVVDKFKSPYISLAFGIYAQNESRLEDISDFLARHGIFSRGNKPLHKDRIKYVLSDPFYVGFFRFGGELYEGIHEPIISKKLFDKVQMVLKDRSKPQHIKDKGRIPKPFARLLRCSSCGMMITAEIQKGHTYYRCTKKSKTISCRELYIREEVLDRQLSSLIQKVSLRQDWANRMLVKLKEEEKDTAQSCRAFVQMKKMEIENINIKLQRLLDAYLDQEIDIETYRFKKAELLNIKKTLEEKVKTFEQTQNAWLEPMRTWVIDAASAANIARGNDLYQKKVLAQKIFGSNLTLNHKIARGNAREPWAALRAAPTSRNWVPPGGFEPPICTLRRYRPGPLDDGGKKLLFSLSRYYIASRLS